MSTRIRLILCTVALLAAAATSQSETLSWVPAGTESLSVPAGSASSGRLCRGMKDGTVYVGSTSNGACEIATTTTAERLSTYEIAVGLATWDSEPVPESTAVIAGKQDGAEILACRVQIDGLYYAGYRRSDGSVCRVNRNGAPVAFSPMQLLYPMSTEAAYRLLSSNSLCVTALAGAPTAPLWQMGCQADPTKVQEFRLDPVTKDVYRLRMPLLNLCLAPASGGTQVALASCGGSASRVRLEYAPEGPWFNVLFEANGNYLQSIPNPTILSSNLGHGMGSRSPNLRFQLRTALDVGRRMHVLTWNTMLLTRLIFPGLQQSLRAEGIAARVAAEDPDLDVITLAETFDTTGSGKLLTALSSAGYRFQAGPPDNPIRSNGGVRIASRWPIERGATLVYGDCTAEDCLAAKGATYAQINKLGRRYHVFVTHLQADTKSTHWDVRRRQLRDLRGFITLIAPSALFRNEPIILTGDFNVDMEVTPNEYNEMLQILGATFNSAPRPVGGPRRADLPYYYTSYPATNTITSGRGGDYGWLDYILSATPGPNPRSVSYEVKDYRTNRYVISDYPLSTNAWLTENLSDHFGLTGRMVFPYGPVAQPEITTVPITFEARLQRGGSAPDASVVVNGQTYPMPVTLELSKEATHTIAVADGQTPSGERLQFIKWSRSSSPSWSLVKPQSAETIRLELAREFLLNVVANPAGGGTVTGSGWYSDGLAAEVTATPAPGWIFAGFSGDLTRTEPYGKLTMSAPRSVLANFRPAATPVLTAIPGLRFDLGVGLRRVQMHLQNSGGVVASGARITAVSVVVTSGSGTVSPITLLPAAVGAIAPGTRGMATIDFNWPLSASRVQMIVQFAADGGYTGSALVNLIR